MMKKLILIILFPVSYSNAQNLVYNPSMEDTLSCNQWIVAGDWPLLRANGWIQYFASSDYFNMDCACGCVALPFLTFGYQFARTGTGMAGFLAYIPPLNSNAREFIGGRLVDSLKIGHTYFIEFYINSANENKYSVDKVGIHFSDDSIYSSVPGDFNYVLPHVENSTGTVISDTLNWTKVSGSFVATGNQKFFCIGVLRPDSLLTIDSIPNFNPTYKHCYYYVDDVSVIDCTATGLYESEFENLITLFPNPTQSKFSISMPATVQLLQTEIYQSTGEKIREFKKEREIDVGNLPKGVFVVRVTTSKRVVFKKFLKL